MIFLELAAAAWVLHRVWQAGKRAGRMSLLDPPKKRVRR